MAFNLTRAAATITGPALAKASTATIRRHPDHSPGTHRVLGPPTDPAPTRNWPWESAWNTLFNNLSRHNTPILA